MQHDQNGFSLLEVLIALQLLMFAFLMLEKINIISFRQTQQAWEETWVNIQLQSMSAWLLINGGEASPFLSTWNQENAILLPEGKGRVQKNKSITIEWHTGVLWHETRTLLI